MTCVTSPAPPSPAPFLPPPRRHPRAAFPTRHPPGAFPTRHPPGAHPADTRGAFPTGAAPSPPPALLLAVPRPCRAGVSAADRDTDPFWGKM